MSGSTNERGTSKVFPSSLQGPSVSSQAGNLVLKKQLSPAHRTSSGEVHVVHERVETSGFGAVEFGEHGLDFSQKTHLFRHKGKHACAGSAGSAGEALAGSRISSHMRGHTRGKSLLCVGSVGEAL